MYRARVIPSFGDTKEGKWLVSNAYKYGCVIRYPKGKEGLTTYHYEPWRIRYVRKETAKVIYEHKWTLEEYINEVQSQ